MTQLNEDQLIKIRRHLHQIPELALQETETHAYLMQVISEMNQQYLEVREFEDGTRPWERSTPNDWLPDGH